MRVLRILALVVVHYLWAWLWMSNPFVLPVYLWWMWQRKSPR